MKAGQLRSYVHVQVPLATQDAAGQGKLLWQDYTKAWGWFENMSAASATLGQTEVDAKSFRFHTRWREGFDRTMRLLYRGRVFDVQAVLNPNERNEELVLVLQEGLKAGG